jgi:hypothetical protein
MTVSYSLLRPVVPFERSFDLSICKIRSANASRKMPEPRARAIYYFPWEMHYVCAGLLIGGMN